MDDPDVRVDAICGHLAVSTFCSVKFWLSGKEPGLAKLVPLAERERARDHQIGAPKPTETALDAVWAKHHAWKGWCWSRV